MTCKDTQKQLLAWLEGELDEGTWLTVTQHLEACPHCRAEAEQMQRLILMLRTIAKSDGIPPMPERLWQRLKPRRSLVPKVIAFFATACIAFLAGWQARGISLPHEPPSAPVTRVTKLPDKPLANTKGIVKPRVSKGLALGLPITYSKAAVSSTLSHIPTRNEINRHRLTLTGATAIAVGWHEPPKHSPFILDEQEQTEPIDNEPFFGWLTWTEPLTDTTNLTSLTEATDLTQLTDSAPYRIFVQVTDPKEQIIRTVHVDTTQPEKIVAEWSERKM